MLPSNEEKIRITAISKLLLEYGCYGPVTSEYVMRGTSAIPKENMEYLIELLKENGIYDERDKKLYETFILPHYLPNNKERLNDR
jgi:hypothetical protein